MKQRQRIAAFTLLELTLAMAVIAILVLLSSSFYQGRAERSRDIRIRNDIKTVEAASDRFFSEHNRWPAAIGAPILPSDAILRYSDRIWSKKGETLLHPTPSTYLFLSMEMLQPYLNHPSNLQSYVLELPSQRILLVGEEAAFPAPLKIPPAHSMIVEKKEGEEGVYGEIVSLLPEGEDVEIPEEALTREGEVVKVWTIGDSAANGKGVRNITLPQGVKVIYGHAFCDNLIRSLIFPDSVERIEANAFAGNKLVWFHLRGEVEFIGEGAFGAGTTVDYSGPGKYEKEGKVWGRTTGS